ncbi:MAG: ABC transporter substrate-binding protein [Rhodospirillales bacterium]|tara:strand:+ start:3072 stop:3716 length:645 start_codon:yes stop_codon:yes gene_type:complete
MRHRSPSSALAAPITAIMLLIAAVVPAAAQAPRDGQAADVITAFHATLLDVMKRADELGVKGRFETLAPAVDKAFHLDLTARQAAGRRSWKDATPAEQTALLDVFRRWTIGTYANQFDGWSGQDFIDHGQKPGPQKGTVLVETELTGKELVTLTYLMVFKDGRWGVYDVLVRRGTTSISQLAKHISEFKSIAKNGLPALTDALETKTRALLGEQ